MFLICIISYLVKNIGIYNFLFNKKYYGIDQKFYDIKIEHISFSNCEKQFHNSISARLITFNGAL